VLAVQDLVQARPEQIRLVLMLGLLWLHEITRSVRINSVF
jgi:hypothetical protein